MSTEASRPSALLAWPPSVTHMGVSLTRICWSAVILADLAQVYRWRDTSFDASAAWVGRWVLPACMVALACLGAGFFTRISALAFFGLVRIVFAHVPETWALDRVTLIVSLVFALAPAPKALAVDVVLRRSKPAPLEIVPAWFSLSLLLCLEIVYGNSALNKLRSTIWRDGLAFWLAATVPHFSAGRLPDALQIPWLVRAPTYVALAFEMFFPLVLIRPLRRWFVITGLLLHLGIAFFLPIPSFGLAFAALYPFLVDWGPIARRLGWAGAAEVVAPPSPRRPALGYLLPAFLAVGEAVGTVPTRLVPAIAGIKPPLALFGLMNYGLYLDFHFTNPKPIVRFVVTSGGRVVDVPSFDERGYPETRNRYWTLLAIGSLRELPGTPSGDAEVNRYLTGALTRAGVRDAEFSLYARDVRVPLEVNPHLAEDLARRPWTLMATGVYRGGHSEISWKESPASGPGGGA